MARLGELDSGCMVVAHRRFGRKKRFEAQRAIAYNRAYLQLSENPNRSLAFVTFSTEIESTDGGSRRPRIEGLVGVQYGPQHFDNGCFARAIFGGQYVEPGV
jgi:hypothetical protein